MEERFTCLLLFLSYNTRASTKIDLSSISDASLFAPVVPLFEKSANKDAKQPPADLVVPFAQEVTRERERSDDVMMTSSKKAVRTLSSSSYLFIFF